MKVVVLGSKGMLGTDLMRVAAQQGLDVTGFDLPGFDITDAGQVAEAVKGADTIVNCAAYTNVEQAESESALAHKVNGDAVGQLGSIAKEIGAQVLHISTDFVFDGSSDTPYVETDEPKPISEYGKSKLAGEELLIESGCDHCIMRIEWTYGSAGNNFVSKIVSLAQKDTSLRVIDDQVGSPTATTEVAKVICELLGKRPTGLYHFASAGFVSRFGMAKFIFDTLGMSVELGRCKSSDYKTAAQRPLNSRFDCGKIAGVLDGPIESWEEMLERFLRQL
ncbi:dTDP-4-dehydrorhamnose reductase [Planctomycetota bacterium]